MKKTHAIMMIISYFLIVDIITLTSYAITWNAETPIVTLMSFDGVPCISQLENGTIWVAWQSDILGNSDIIFRAFYGGTWSELNPLVADEAINTAPAIMEVENGTIWLAWAADVEGTGNYDIYYKIWNPSVMSWSSSTQLTNHLNRDSYPSAVQAEDGSIWIVWQRKNFPGSYDNLVYKIFNGTHWSEEYQLTTELAHDRVPAISRTRDGRLWVTWSSLRTGDWEVFFKTYNGTLWSTEQQLTFSNSYDDVNPSIVQARDGSIWIVWASCKQTQNAADDVYYKTSLDNGETWGEPQQLTSHADTDTWPSITQASDKTLWVVWSSDRLGTFDIFYTNSSQIPIHDVAIADIQPFKSVAFQDEIVPINVTAENRGDYNETFTVSCYVNSSLIGSEAVALTAENSSVLTFSWDTTTFPRGLYVINATASPVPGENPIITDDNTLHDEIIKLVVPDLNLTEVSPLRSSVAQGYIANIDVTVRNEGNIDQTFNVTLRYDSTDIETQTVYNLNPNESVTLTFNWDTTGVSLGTYVISAEVEPVPFEKDLGDNSLIDGTVRVTMPGDVDGDGDVDIADLSYIARAFGTTPNWPHGTSWGQWNPNADINNDKKVDATDLYLAAINYGRVEGG